MTRPPAGVVVREPHKRVYLTWVGAHNGGNLGRFGDRRSGTRQGGRGEVDRKEGMDNLDGATPLSGRIEDTGHLAEALHENPQWYPS